MLTYVCVTSPEAPARFGFIITKAVGKAHVRNTVRRKLKAASLHAIRNGLSGRDVVIRAHPACASASWDQLVSAVSTAVLARGER